MLFNGSALPVLLFPWIVLEELLCRFLLLAAPQVPVLFRLVCNPPHNFCAVLSLDITEKITRVHDLLVSHPPWSVECEEVAITTNSQGDAVPRMPDVAN